MLSDLKAEEDELLHGENCWMQSDNIQTWFNSADDKIQLFQGLTKKITSLWLAESKPIYPLFLICTAMQINMHESINE